MSTIRKAFAGLSAILYCGWAAAAVEAPAPVEQPNYVYPQERIFGAYKAILHAPQIESWDFTRFNGVMAIEFFPDAGTKEVLGTIALSGNTEVDLAERLVHVTDITIEKVSLKADMAKEYEAAVRAGVRKGPHEVPLDIFLLSLDDAILDRPPPAGFTKTPPDIIVSTTPAIVLFVNGKPVLTDLPGTDLKLVVNANWPLVTDATSSVYYLLDREVWLTAPKLAGPWTATRKLPKGLQDLDKNGDHALIAAAVPAPKTKQATSTVHVREVPTEIVVIDGEPTLEEIPGATGLSYVTNSESALFKSGATWYFPVAGRWFSTADPFKGPWTFVETLPEAFAAIPEDHKIAYVRSSVRGTLEAKVAALESLLPKRKSVALDAKPAIEVSYAGDPQFEPIEGTVVARAVNTGYDVIQFKDGYYLCYAGVWYASVAPIGPWLVAKHVPKEIYAIPPSSPSYHVTQVTVVAPPPRRRRRRRRSSTNRRLRTVPTCTSCTACRGTERATTTTRIPTATTITPIRSPTVTGITTTRSPAATARVPRGTDPTAATPIRTATTRGPGATAMLKLPGTAMSGRVPARPTIRAPASRPKRSASTTKIPTKARWNGPSSAATSGLKPNGRPTSTRGLRRRSARLPRADRRRSPARWTTPATARRRARSKPVTAGRRPSKAAAKAARDRRASPDRKAARRRLIAMAGIRAKIRDCRRRHGHVHQERREPHDRRARRQWRPVCGPQRQCLQEDGRRLAIVRP